MACIILIHAKNWQEKNRVLECLNDDISSEVIVDLKKYVEEKYKGKFVKDEEDDGDSTQMEAVEPVENKDIPSLESMSQNDQMTGTGGNTSTNVNTIVPEEDGYGTFIPYRDRMVEPKEEDLADEAVTEIDKLVANMKEGGQIGEQLANECGINPPETIPQLKGIAHNKIVTADPYIVDNTLPIDNISSPTDINNMDTTTNYKDLYDEIQDETVGNKREDSPKKKTNVSRVDNGSSSSTVTRSGRVVKRPAYSMDDEDREDDDPAPIKRSSTTREPTKPRKAQQKVSSTPRKQAREERNEDECVTTGVECKKCLKQLSAKFRKYSNAKDHAVTHTDIIRYECPVDGCGYKSGPYSNFDNHARKKHGRPLSPKNIDLTTEQVEELDQMIKDCFPDFAAREKNKKCALCQSVVSCNNFNQYHLKRHSLQHIDFMLYKCNLSPCEFQTKSYKHMVEHGQQKHKIGKISKEETEIELTDDQKKEIDEMLKKCFSKTDNNNTVAPGIECKKCMKQLSVEYRQYSNAKDHAFIHTDLKRYECPMDGCDYKNRDCKSMKLHIRLKHNNCLLPARKIDLTVEQKEELEKMTQECFPEFAKNKVCTVCQVAVWNSSLNQRYPKQHSLQHIGFMLYKCNQPNCQFETKWFEQIGSHGVMTHGIKGLSKEETKIELTDDQKKEIDEMLKRCCPDGNGED